MSEQNIAEVWTPISSHYASIDTNIDIIELAQIKPVTYLRTSPEYEMKILLSLEHNSIYQISHAFRREEIGNMHKMEFCLLEYYLVNADLKQLQESVLTLITHIYQGRDRLPLKIKRMSYRQVFQEYLEINPHNCVKSKLEALANKKLKLKTLDLSRDTLLDGLFSFCILPQFEQNCFYFVDEYPASMGALARIKTNEFGEQVAERFELYLNGFELANAYHEITEYQEYYQRFTQINEHNPTVYPLPKPLLEKLRQRSLPKCAGVAMGIERVVMALAGVKKIQDLDFFE